MTRSANRVTALLAGAALAALGIAGIVASLLGAAEETPLLAGVLPTNGAQGGLHLALGAALLVAGIAGRRAAKTVNVVAGVVLFVLGYAGLFVVGTPYDVLGMSGAANVVHFAAATLLLAVGIGTERPRASPSR